MSAPFETQDLSFGYSGRAIGRRISFALEHGETLCLLGANGGGKTTLFKTLLGLLPPIEGRILIDGEDISGWSAHRRARMLAYVPQAGAGHFGFTVREMVLMGRTAHRGAFEAPRRTDYAAVDSVLSEMNITHLAERDWLRISGGEKQLVLIARALAQEARILIFDEPTANLDFGNQLRVIEQIRRLAKTGLAVMFSTHHPEQAFACANRVALLHDGQFAALGAPDEVITPASMKLTYGVDVEIVSTGSMRVCIPSQVYFPEDNRYQAQTISDGDLGYGSTR